MGGKALSSLATNRCQAGSPTEANQVLDISRDIGRQCVKIWTFSVQTVMTWNKGASYLLANVSPTLLVLLHGSLLCLTVTDS